MKKFIYAIASLTALTAQIDAASAGSLSANGTNLYDGYKTDTKMDTLVAANPEPAATTLPVEETPVPSNPYESLAATPPAIQAKISSSAPSSEYDVVVKSEPQAWKPKQEIPEPTSALALLAIAGAIAATRRKSNQPEVAQ